MDDSSSLHWAGCEICKIDFAYEIERGRRREMYDNDLPVCACLMLPSRKDESPQGHRHLNCILVNIISVKNFALKNHLSYTYVAKL